MQGQALDLLHGASLVADQRIGATGYEAIPDSDLVMITAGLRRKPDESRLDLINRNVDLFLNILGQVKGRRAPRARRIVLVVSNPVDVSPTSPRPGSVCRRTRSSAWARARYGAVSQPDCRGTEAPTHPGHRPDPGRAWRQHGADLVGRAGGRAATGKVSRLDQRRGRGLFTRTKGSGAEVIKLKGGAGFAVGCRSARWFTRWHSTRSESSPVSSLVQGQYGIRDVCISVPTVVGRKGVEAQLEIDSGPRKSRPCSTRPRSSAKRSTRFEQQQSGRQAGRGVRPDLGWETAAAPVPSA